MSSSVELLGNEPILVLKFSGEADSKLVSDAYLNALELAQSSSNALYWLVDVRSAGQSASLIASALKEIVRGLVGAPVMPSMNMAFIAQPETDTDLAWKTPPAGWFTDDAAALRHARAQIAESTLAH